MIIGQCIIIIGSVSVILRTRTLPIEETSVEHEPQHRTRSRSSLCDPFAGWKRETMGFRAQKTNGHIVIFGRGAQCTLGNKEGARENFYLTFLFLQVSCKCLHLSSSISSGLENTDTWVH